MSEELKTKLITAQIPKIEIIEYVGTRELENVGKNPIRALAVGETINKLIVKIQSSDKNFPDGKHYVIRIPNEMFEDISQTMDEQYKQIMKENESSP